MIDGAPESPPMPSPISSAHLGLARFGKLGWAKQLVERIEAWRAF